MNSITQLCTITGLLRRVIDKWLVGRASPVSQRWHQGILPWWASCSNTRSLQEEALRAQLKASKIIRDALQRASLRHLHEGRVALERPSSGLCQEQSVVSRPNTAKRWST